MRFTLTMIGICLLVIVRMFVELASPVRAADIPYSERIREHPDYIRCGDPCVVHSNPGGVVGVFLLAGHQAGTEKHRGVVIDGDCFSSCTLFAQAARPNVCVTRKTVMGFHMAKDPNGMEYPLPAYSDIRTWIMDRGGEPPNAGGIFLVMRWPETNKFWPECAITFAQRWGDR